MQTLVLDVLDEAKVNVDVEPDALTFPMLGATTQMPNIKLLCRSWCWTQPQPMWMWRQTC